MKGDRVKLDSKSIKAIETRYRRISWERDNEMRSNKRKIKELSERNRVLKREKAFFDQVMYMAKNTSEDFESQLNGDSE